MTEFISVLSCIDSTTDTKCLILWANVYLADIVYLVTYLIFIISVDQRKDQIPVTILIQLIISSDTYVKISLLSDLFRPSLYDK